MRSFLTAFALLFAAAPALAGGAEEFFLGRPPSVGVVQGGAFGSGGFDYAGEMHTGSFTAPPVRRPPRSGRRVVHAGRVPHGEEPSIVARPYFRP